MPRVRAFFIEQWLDHEHRKELLLLGFIVAAAALLRILSNDVASYSTADERVYTEHTRFLIQHGWLAYPAFVARYLGDSTQWLYPPPLRWGFFALTTTSCHLAQWGGGVCDERTLAWLSTLAGVACVPLTYLLGARLVSPRVGLLGAALTVTSPLQLALGRRALQDEVFCAVILLALLALLPIVSSYVSLSWRRYALAMVALTAAFSIKETSFLLYPPLVALLVAAVRRRGWRRADVLLLLLPPILYVLGFALWSRSLSDFFRVAAMVAGTADADYPARFQAGPPHRIWLDLFTLAPIVCILAVGAIAMIASRVNQVEPGVRLLALLTVALALVFTVVTSKNVRYAIMLDPLLRLLAAWALLDLLRARARLMATVVLASGAAELALFYSVFIVAKVYDPVTATLLRALDAIP